MLMQRLEIPFVARSGSGVIEVTVDRTDDPTRYGQVSTATGFPICTATVAFDLKGYNGLLGWVQTVGTKSSPDADRIFEVDPLQVFEGLELPFGFYGLNPVMFDAPYRSDRTKYLDWLAQAFLCVAPTHPMEKEVGAVAGFSWGFRMSNGDVSIGPVERLHATDWSKHLETFSQRYPSWRFSTGDYW